MASVRLNEQRKQAIGNKAYNLFSKQMAKKETALDDTIWERLATAYYTEVIEPHMENFPVHWVIDVEQINIHLSHTNSVNATETYAPKRHYNPRLNTALRVPNVKSLVDHYNELDIPDNWVRPTELQDEYNKWRTDIQKVGNERDEFVLMVKNLLKKCNTLKQFLEAWPQGEELINPEDLETHNSVVVKPKREVKSIEADAKLGGILLKQKLLGS